MLVLLSIKWLLLATSFDSATSSPAQLITALQRKFSALAIVLILSTEDSVCYQPYQTCKMNFADS